MLAFDGCPRWLTGRWQSSLAAMGGSYCTSALYPH